MTGFSGNLKEDGSRNPRILFLTGREIGYQRNAVILKALRQFADVKIPAPRLGRSILNNSIQRFFRALPGMLRGQYDLIFIGFFGQFLVLPIRAVTRTPILFDAFISAYDTLCFDRKVISPKSAAGQLVFSLDRHSCRAADHILLDTPQHIRYFADTFRLPAGKMSAIPVGCDETLFHPLQLEPRPGFNVLYYLSYQKLHGADVVLSAARNCLSDSKIRFRLIGDGPDYAATRERAARENLHNIDFVPYVPISALPGEIAGASICLGGHFGTSDKADRVIPGKAYQILAMAKPLIASASEANRAYLTDQQNALLVPAGDADALTQAIMDLYTHPERCKSIAEAGHQLYLTTASEAILTQQIDQTVQAMLCDRNLLKNPGS